MMIYVHIPFCQKKCNYCAFNSKVSFEAEKNLYVKALLKEISQHEDSEQVETIYFGGGTPTLLSLEQLEEILNLIDRKFSIDSDAEITIEANPNTINKIFLSRLKHIGFNRLSLGVQSFEDKLLRITGRTHDSKIAKKVIINSMSIFENVSIDLIYGLPTQTIENLNYDLELVKKFGVNHVSVYGLELEENTNFFELSQKGQITLPDRNLVADMYDFITEKLPAFGYERYEISNFAKKGFESRHNIGYWTNKKYFGFGAGAHSFNGRFRTSNVRDVTTYINGVNNKKIFFSVEEVVDLKTAMEEFCFLGLRMTSGINVRTFKKKFSKDIFEIFGSIIQKNKERGMIEVSNDKVFLTSRGMSLGNKVLADFLL